MCWCCPRAESAVDALDRDVLAAMPGVEQASQPNGFILLHPDGRFVNGETLVATDDDFLHTIARPVMLEGRLPVAADEIYATQGGRDELGIEVGEQVELLVLPDVTYANQDELPDDFLEQAMNGIGGVRTDVHARRGGVRHRRGHRTRPVAGDLPASVQRRAASRAHLHRCGRSTARW